jgi:hypothetical protein
MGYTDSVLGLGATHVTAATPPARSPRDDAKLLAALRKACVRGEVTIDLDMKRLTHLNSPLMFLADFDQWFIGFVVVAGLAWWLVGWKLSAAAVPVFAVLYMLFAHRIVQRRTMRRITEKAMFEIDQWRKIWGWGGVTLIAKIHGAERRAVAPKDSWQEIAAGFLAQS